LLCYRNESRVSNLMTPRAGALGLILALFFLMESFFLPHLVAHTCEKQPGKLHWQEGGQTNQPVVLVAKAVARRSLRQTIASISFPEA